jgi:hypothetical protein
LTTASLVPMNDNTVSTRVYKYNPNGLVLLGVYIICLGVAIFHLISMSTTQILIYGSIFLAIPMYVQYGNSRKIRLMIWDERKLIFSSGSIDFGEDHYPINELEAAAVFLDSFDGFEFRGLKTPGMRDGGRLLVYRKADGDNNKISFRHEGQVEDFSFYLANYNQFVMFQAILQDWSAAGVNVVLQQTYDDDFIRSEMAYYNTSAGNE